MSSDIKSVTYDDAVPVSASDTTNDPAGPFAGIYVPAAGNYKVRTVRNRDVTFTALAAGTIVPCAILRIWSTGTQGNGANVLGMIAPPYKGPGPT